MLGSKRADECANQDATRIDAANPSTTAAQGRRRRFRGAMRRLHPCSSDAARVAPVAMSRNGAPLRVLRPPDKARPALKRQGLPQRSHDVKTKCGSWAKNREIIGECIVCGAPIRYGCDPDHRSAWGGGWDNAPERCVQDPTLKVWTVGKHEVHGIGSKACRTWYLHYLDEIAREESCDPPDDTRLTVHEVKAIRQSIRQAAEAERVGSLAWRPSP